MTGIGEREVTSGRIRNVHRIYASEPRIKLFRSRRHQRASALLVSVLATIVFTAQLGAKPAAQEHVVVAPISPLRFSLQDLSRAADVIATVRPTGRDRVHWNNQTNTRWTSPDKLLPMIYNDQEVVVIDQLRGAAPHRLIVRNIGGVVGNTRFEIEDLDPLEPAHLYLVFLEFVDTPTQEGSERALSFVARHQGIFVETQGLFVNGAALAVLPQDLKSIR